MNYEFISNENDMSRVVKILEKNQLYFKSSLSCPLYG